MSASEVAERDDAERAHRERDGHLREEARPSECVNGCALFTRKHFWNRRGLDSTATISALGGRISTKGWDILPMDCCRLRRFTVIAATFAAVIEACGGDDSANPIPTDGGPDRTAGSGAALTDAVTILDTTTGVPEASVDVVEAATPIESGVEATVSDSAIDGDAQDGSLLDGGGDARSEAGVVLPPCGVTRYSVPEGGSAQWIAPSPDGELWFTSGGNTVGRVSPLGLDGGQGSATLINQSFHIWARLAAGPDGEMWVVDQQQRQLRQFLTADGGGPTAAIYNALFVTRGSGSTLWFSDNLTGTLALATFTQLGFRSIPRLRRREFARSIAPGA
jgi:hypothetical protein